jgi:membrane protease YdiL (CAAX protease family)
MLGAERAAAIAPTTELRPSTAPPWLDPATDRPLVGIALAVTLLISRLPQIVLQDVFGFELGFMPWLSVGLTAAMWVGARTSPRLRPLERYLAIMIVVGVAIGAIEAIASSAPWEQFQASLPPMVGLLAIRVVMAAAALLVIMAGLALGATRSELYLRVGDLDAPTNIRRKNGELLGWRRFGPLAVVGLMLLMVWFTAPLLPDDIDLPSALPLIAIGAVTALLNAFWEEAAFRSAPLAMLQRAIGPGAGVVILAIWFGLGHYYGGAPSGLMGTLAAGASALLFGRAMIETRGLGWPVALHFAGDLVIFTFLAIAAAS